MITILGSSGFIGSRLASRLDELSLKYQAIGRHDALPTGNLGTVIYCIGLTADFRSRPFDTVEAHVCKLLEVLRDSNFDTLLYLSSTRLYTTSVSASANQSVRVAPADPDDLYNISKVMGEAITLNCGKPTRVARVSNVYGADFTSANFLSSIIRDAIATKKIVLQTAATSAKDYISVDDVVDGLIAIATKGGEQIYNVASGVNVSNLELAEKLRSLTGCSIEIVPDAPVVSFPPINVERMQSEFDFRPSLLLDDLPQLVTMYKEKGSSHDQS